VHAVLLILVINVYPIFIVMVHNVYAHQLLNIGIQQQVNVILSINISIFAINQLHIAVVQMLHYFVYQLVKDLNVHLMPLLIQILVIVLMEPIGTVDHALLKKLLMHLVFGVVNVILPLVYNVLICHVFVPKNFLGHQQHYHLHVKVN